ncbi:hypothetical protein EFZ10_08025 [Tatumella sp. TA1]|nr:hypothetical protein EFZ10_08025 [Tatumella sp. TA1]
MTLTQARNNATMKKGVGWIIFILSTLSTAISLLNYLSTQRDKLAGVNAVLADFVRVIVDMIRFNTRFLDVFWHHSPVPNFSDSTNVTFWLIFFLIFFGMALNAAGSRQWRQNPFRQYYLLYILPIIVVVIGYVLLHWLTLV